MKKIFISILLLFTILSVYGQKYALDNTFGDNGIIRFVTDYSYSLGYKIVALDDGSYLVSSIIDDEKNKMLSFSIIKFQNNGKTDQSFGENGYINILTDHSDYLMDFIALPDKKIAYAISDINGYIELIILNENGTFNKKFTFSPFSNNYIIPLKLLFNDDHIYMGGIYNSKNTNSELMFVLKMDLNGNPDENFAVDGFFIGENNIGLNAKFKDMAFQNDEIIVLCSENDLSDIIFLFRIDENGVVDSGFSADGVYSTISAKANEYGNLNVDSAGNIYITFFNSPGIYKINPEGFNDKNYGDDGHALDDNFLNAVNNSFYSIIQNDNSILLFGTTEFGTADQFGYPAILKYNKNGKNDVPFGDKGLYITETGHPAAFLNGCFDAENNLLAVGGWEKLSENQYSQLLVTRYKSLSSGNDETNITNHITLFPNPVRGNNVNFEYNYPINTLSSYSIFDTYGNKISSNQLKPKSVKDDLYKIEMPPDLLNGLYFLVLYSDKGSNSVKFIVHN